MIVLEDFRLVVLTPPHTASGMLHRVLRHWGGMVVVGPNVDGNIDHHTVCVANGWIDFRTVVIARDSKARFNGLWHHHSWWCAMNGMMELSLREFALAVARDDASILSWFYRYPLRRWLGDRHFDDVVMLESIEPSLSAILGAPFRMPPVIESHPPWQASWTDEITAVLASWLKEDFLRRLDDREVFG